MYRLSRPQWYYTTVPMALMEEMRQCFPGGNGLMEVLKLPYNKLRHLTLYCRTCSRCRRLPYISFPSIAFSTNDLRAHPIWRSCH